MRARSKKPTPSRTKLARPAGAPEFFTTREAAAYIGMSEPFLRLGRQAGMLGNSTPLPPHHQIGRSIKYSRADLDQWLAERRVDRSHPKRSKSNTAAPVV